MKTFKQFINEKNDFDQCYQKACDVYDREQKAGHKPELYQIAGYKGNADKADSRWKKMPSKYWHHYVTKVGNTVYDPTAKQFHPDNPTQYHHSELDKMWKEKYRIER